MQKKILIVEDSQIVLKVLQHLLKSSTALLPIYAESLAAAKATLESKEHDFFAALVDLNLPDAPDGEVVDLALQHALPTIVLTGSFDSQRRKSLLDKGVVDYITKEGRFSYEFAVKLINRLVKNEHIQVLVVDDSKVGRKSISNLLRLQRFAVFEAEDGMQGIKTLLENPAIKLVITDYNMPRMDGCAMVQALRGKYEKADLTIIGLSSEGEEALSARFIKCGANDFLRKPFNHEEFFCRVTHNVELMEMMDSLRDASRRDALTGAYSHPYFFQHGSELLALAKAKQTPFAVAAIELDNFKQINSDFGHEAGDLILKSAAAVLLSACQRFLFARAGAHEFYLLMLGLDGEKALAFVEKVKQLLGATDIDCGQSTLRLTCSAGVCSTEQESLDAAVDQASQLAARAREAGGGFVIADIDDEDV